MSQPTYPPTTTRGNDAATITLAMCVLLTTTTAALVLAVVSAFNPEPVGGVAVLAVVLGLAGVGAGALGEAVRP